MLLHCFAGCETEIIIKTLGLSWADLFDDQGQAKNVNLVCDSREQYAYSLTGRTALTDRDTMLAVIRLARMHNTLTVICASRTIAELSGVSRRTAPTSLERHVAAGALKYAGTGTRSASRYTLSHYCPVFYPDTQVSPINENTGQKWDKETGRQVISGEASQWAGTEQEAGLTKRAILVWCALTDDPATVREITEVTGVPKTTVERLLKLKLRRLGYAVHTPDGWVRGYHVYDPDTDTFAGPIVANRKAQHRKDREQWARVQRARKYKRGNPDVTTYEKDRTQETPIPYPDGYTCHKCGEVADNPVKWGVCGDCYAALKQREAMWNDQLHGMVG